jgi:hypothetical protein
MGVLHCLGFPMLGFKARGLVYHAIPTWMPCWVGLLFIQAGITSAQHGALLLLQGRATMCLPANAPYKPRRQGCQAQRPLCRVLSLKLKVSSCALAGGAEIRATRVTLRAPDPNPTLSS